MKKTVLVLFLILGISYLFGETFYGIVKDEKNKVPVPSAEIKISQSAQTAYTNSKGRFFIKNLKSGSYNIIISRIGYKTKKIKVKFPSDNNLKIFLEIKATKLTGLIISDSWAKKGETPVTFDNKTKKEIQNSADGSDVTLMVNDIPNIISYTESGNSVGNSHIKIRGFNEERIGVMVNGIPLNDPEDQQVYWVDLPDMPESTDNVQVQKGAGSTIYGISTFGGSLNLETNKYEMKNYSLISLYGGSYNTHKLSVRMNRGIFPSYVLNVRLSKLHTDGYREHSNSDMYSGFIGLSHLGIKSSFNFNIYGGAENTQATWYASSQSDLENNHRNNPITYPDEDDNFIQPHFEFHHRYILSDKIYLKNTLFYIHGTGFYKQLKKDKKLREYGLVPVEDSLSSSDLVRKKNVTKDQVGWVGKIHYEHPNGKLILGTYLSAFASDHYGIVDSVGDISVLLPKDYRYYNYKGNKNYKSLFLQEKYSFGNLLNFMLNLQYLNISYDFRQKEAGNFTGEYLNQFNVKYNFFNPSIGLFYNPTENINLYTNFSISHREPTDSELYDTWDGPDDLGVQPLFAHCDTLYDETGNVKNLKWSDPLVKSEDLSDIELGSEFKTPFMNLKLNLFYMTFNNEIVPYGGANEDGNPIRGNADKSIHRGVEISLKSNLPLYTYLSASASYNDNYFKKFILHTWDSDRDVITKDYSDKKIPGFPNVVANVKLGYEIDRLNLYTQMNYYGRQYLDAENLNDRSIDPYFLLNLGANISLCKKSDNVTLTIRANNILNKKYYTDGYYDDWDSENYFWPGAEFNFKIGLRIKFGNKVRI